MMPPQMPPDMQMPATGDPKQDVMALFEQLVASGMDPDQAMQIIMQLQGPGAGGGQGPGIMPPEGM